jgi:hypothetical protein
MRCAWASVACSASNGSSSPTARAVPGMNCAMPWAPAGDRANGLKPLSTYSSAPETLQRCAAREIAGANCAGTKDCSATVRAPSPPPKPTDDVPALADVAVLLRVFIRRSGRSCGSHRSGGSIVRPVQHR